MKRHLQSRPNIQTVAWLLMAAGLFVLAACAPDAPQDTLKPEGPVAIEIDNLFWPVFWVATAIFVVVQGLIIVAVVRFREKSGSDEEPPQIHGNTKLEITWTVIPFLILVVVAAMTVPVIFAISDHSADDDTLEIEVIGHQWWWEYRYPEPGVITANEIHIPTNRRVRLNLNSNDVIHSFWIPKLAGKQDVVPGRTNYLVIEATEPTKPGEALFGQCVEFCGISHANMRLRAVVHTPESFENWLEEQKRPAVDPAEGTRAAEGKKIFESKACVGCHTIAGTAAQARVGPDLTHFASRETFAGSIFERVGPEGDATVARWLKDPPAMKPGSKMPNLNLTDEEVSNLVAYLQSLK